LAPERKGFERRRGFGQGANLQERRGRTSSRWVGWLERVREVPVVPILENFGELVKQQPVL